MADSNLGSGSQTRAGVLTAGFDEGKGGGDELVGDSYQRDCVILLDDAGSCC